MDTRGKVAGVVRLISAEVKNELQQEFERKLKTLLGKKSS